MEGQPSKLLACQLFGPKKAVLMERFRNKQVASSSKGGSIRKLRTKFKSQVGMGYLTFGKDQIIL